MNRRRFIKLIVAMCALLSLIGAGSNFGDYVLWWRMLGAVGTTDTVGTTATILDISPDFPKRVQYQYPVENAEGKIDLYQGTWESVRLIDYVNSDPDFQPFMVEYLANNPQYALPANRYWTQSFHEELEDDVLWKTGRAGLRSVLFAIATFVSLLMLRKI